MKKNNLILKIIMVLILSLSVGVYSCIDLDEDTRAQLAPETFYKTIDDLNAGTIALYSPLVTYWQAFSVAQHKLYLQGGDDLTTSSTGDLNKWIFWEYDKFNPSGSNPKGDGLVYKPHWKSIRAANSLINNGPLVDGDETEKAVFIAEGYFVRAFNYFFLGRIFGGLPLILTPSDEVNYDIVRLPLSEIYDQIISDLETAIADLPDAQADAGRPTSWSAKAMLAQVHLARAGWPLDVTSSYATAAALAKDVIDNGPYQLLDNYADIWDADLENHAESVWAAQFSDDAYGAFNYVYIGSAPPTEKGWGDFCSEIYFFNSFPEGPRKDATFYTIFKKKLADLAAYNDRLAAGATVEIVDDNGTDLYFELIPWNESPENNPFYVKWRKQSAINIGRITYPSNRSEYYLRFAEVLLIYAEAKIMATGSSSEPSALEALNKIKRRAMGLPVDVAAPGLDVASATQADIVQERAWELAGEYSRWFDMTRTEIVESVTDNRDPNDILLFASPTKANYFSPYPQFEIDLNPNMGIDPDNF